MIILRTHLKNATMCSWSTLRRDVLWFDGKKNYVVGSFSGAKSVGLLDGFAGWVAGITIDS